ncbi:hypothetical protein [Herbiconiux sp. L3-i23]|uniref:hypothetical protein n=1 Tax=Herbiconiux sp. L3-i23 TaxID=2905871 RepID=UPI002056966E|nr:hypothetical protein [Herbiconiux sp. L3-i23]BDI21527.1 hypothetical protein L3i23_03030 [Herbiconiux sp. L3-i23]
MTTADDFDAAAGSLERLIVLARAGVPPTTAWTRLRQGDEKGRGDASPARTRWRRRREPDPHPHLADEVVEAVFLVATRAGAPIAAAMRAQAVALRERAQHAREAEIAATGPRMTARVLLGLPIGGALLATALGFDVVGALTRSPLGWTALIIGMALAASGAVWTARMVGSIAASPRAPGLLLDLAAVAVLGGMPPESSITIATRAIPPRLRDDDDVAAATRTIAFARRSGAPIASLLVEEAAMRRRVDAARSRREVERLSTRLLAPLGVCILPSFLLIGVLPVLTAVISSTVTAP